MTTMSTMIVTSPSPSLLATVGPTPAPTPTHGGGNDPTSLRRENLQLKQSLAMLQNEYEELKDDSKFHQAKVNELSDILMQRAKKSGQDNVTAQERTLIEKTYETAQLKVQIDNLKSQLAHANNEVHTLKYEKQGNNKLILELSDIVRTLSSVQISYSAATDDDDDDDAPKSAQHSSIQNVKRKIESIMSDRALLVRRCKELEEETSEQQDKIKALEGQFHLVNAINFIDNKDGKPKNSNGSAASDSKTATLSSSSVSSSSSAVVNGPSSPKQGNQQQAAVDDGAANVSPLSHPSSSSSSSPADGIQRRHLSRSHKSQSATKNGKNNMGYYSSDDISVGNDSTTSGISLIERQVFEERLHLQEQRHNEAVQQLCEEHEEQLEKAQADRDGVSKQLQSLKKKMQATKEKMEDAIISRDEFKGSLRDIIDQYKDLHKQHSEATDRIALLEGHIESLQTEMVRREEQWTKQQSQETGIKVDKKWMPWTPKDDEAQQCVDEDEDEATTIKEESASGRAVGPLDVADECTTIATAPTTSPIREGEQEASDTNDATMEDLLTAYARAMEKIESLEAGEGNKNEETDSRCEKLEQELNNYKQKLSKVEKEAQNAKEEAKKEREEAKHVQRRLTAYKQMQQKEQKDSNSKSNRSNNVSGKNRIIVDSNSTTEEPKPVVESIFGPRLKRRTPPSPTAAAAAATTSTTPEQVEEEGNTVVAPHDHSATAGASSELKALLAKRDALMNAKQRVEEEEKAKGVQNEHVEESTTAEAESTKA
mmetsp:Transcript_54345/g.131904  ORF Transcript_54345/g.131904 Transcript_54345/m.131904 type:complete len:769 (-) Transcript_54345:153-2459(-)